MKSDTISTLSSREIMRVAMTRNQARLSQTLHEFSTGRHADVGRALGSRIAAVLDMRHALGDLTALAGTNAIVSSRLENAQAALSGVRQLAAGFIDIAISVRQSGAQPTLLATDAKSRLGSTLDMLSVTSNGTYIFSGTNSSVPPLDNYLAEQPGPARSAVIAAFTTEFGFPPDDPQVSTIIPAQLDAYLDGPFAALFDDPAWGANFSNATDEVMRNRISLGEEIETSATANEAGIRQLFHALAMAIDTGVGGMNAETRSTLSNHLVEAGNAAVYGIVRQESALGIAQERLTQATERIAIGKQALERRISGAEDVDPYEVAERLGLLMSRIEASYSITARLQQLSLTNYL
jgi:flagellar hook-associated protein 3 FlgL